MPYEGFSVRVDEKKEDQINCQSGANGRSNDRCACSHESDLNHLA